MSWASSIGWRKTWLPLGVVTLLGLTAMRLCAGIHKDPPEIALVLGEPYEEMRKRSSAKIDEALPGHWFRMPRSDARLRFIDPVHGFVTPTARFLTVGFDDGMVSDVRMSPQTEPLLLDDALRIALDLQDQWRKGGWVFAHEDIFQPFEDTKEWRERLRDCQSNASFWRAGNKYQTQLGIACFADDAHPNEQRFLLSLEISDPY
jgi:hypothetical protein